MQIVTTDFVAGAAGARGVAVIIDVFRAFSLAAYAYAQGVRAIVPVASIEHARELKRRHPDWLLVGERHARPLPDFDCGNSPTQLARLDVRGRTLIHTTHSGTQGLTAANGAEEVVAAALVNARAVVSYLAARDPDTVTLVRMGHEARERCAEDDLCAELLEQRLRGLAARIDAAEQLKDAPGARKFFDPECVWAPSGDFDACTRIDAFDFVLRRERCDGEFVLRRIDPPFKRACGGAPEYR